MNSTIKTLKFNVKHQEYRLRLIIYEIIKNQKINEQKRKEF
jgi:hypothetical protein